MRIEQKTTSHTWMNILNMGDYYIKQHYHYCDAFFTAIRYVGYLNGLLSTSVTRWYKSFDEELY